IAIAKITLIESCGKIGNRTC
ncbi:cobalamin biosynthesis protein CbiG, partial [Arthrospira sp. O9.13F]